MESTSEGQPPTQTISSADRFTARRLVQWCGIYGADTDDLAQEVLLVLSRKGTEVPAAGEPRDAFMLGIARRLAANHERARRRRQAIERDAAVNTPGREGPSVEEQASARELGALVEEALAELSRTAPALHAVLALVVDGVAVADIGKALSIPKNTAWNRLYLAREALAEAVHRLRVRHRGERQRRRSAMSIELRAEPAPPLAWGRVLGRAALRRDYGHAIAVNASGRVLVAARFDVSPMPRDDGNDTAGNAGDAGELVQLDAEGAPRWSVALPGEEARGAPHVAMDDSDASYVAGPFEPSSSGALHRAVRRGVTKLDSQGRPVWCAPVSEAGPGTASMDIAADPCGGACVAFCEGGALCAVRFNDAGAQLWERRFPFLGPMRPYVRVGIDATGAATLWGSFAGTLSIGEASLAARGWERFVARVTLDGRARWSRVPQTTGATDSSIALHRDGTVSLAAVVCPPEGSERRDARDLLLVKLDAQGNAIEHARFPGAPHACASVKVASAGDAVVLGGYVSGSFVIAGHTVRSAEPATEAVYVARVGDQGGTWARSLPGPQLQAGLSVHGQASGAVTIAGWCAGGSMDLGGVRLPGEARAALFVARYQA